ncbi:MAG: hypothetical protein WBC70_14615 [Candidatus Aminicenantales bacterium]
MENKRFEELLIAVKGQDQAEIRRADIVRVLKELLRGEFAGVKETRFRIMLKRPETGGCGAVNKVDGIVNLWIDPENWKRDPRFSEESLKSLISHELLHLELRLDDDSPLFKIEAKRRNIDLWRRP